MAIKLAGYSAYTDKCRNPVWNRRVPEVKLNEWETQSSRPAIPSILGVSISLRPSLAIPNRSTRNDPIARWPSVHNVFLARNNSAVSPEVSGNIQVQSNAASTRHIVCIKIVEFVFNLWLMHSKYVFCF